MIWADGPICPHCSGFDRIIKVKSNAAKRICLGLYRCGDCNRQFTVKIGIIFERGRIPLNKMLQPVYLLTSSKKFIVLINFIVRLRLPTSQYGFWPTASAKPCQWRFDAVRL
ncbi:transposase [Acetobacter indonesiensis]|uniref:transposase n=1 Tax=Acetobacter indonesiensis TaxID=104101 RepID=UPI00130E80EB